jgi:hypothetical protein
MAEQGAAMEEETDGASVAVDTPNHPAAMEEENATIMGVPEFEDEEALAEEALAEEQPADRPSVSGVTIEHGTSWVAGGGVGYHMQVHSEDGGRWMCVRRYSEFAGLREEVVARCQQPSRRRALLGLPFPEKRMFGSADLDTVKERQRDLERWMNRAGQQPRGRCDDPRWLRQLQRRKRRARAGRRGLGGAREGAPAA